MSSHTLRSALHARIDTTKAKELLDGVPGAKEAGLSSMVVKLEGTTRREAHEAWGKLAGIPWLADALESAD